MKKPFSKLNMQQGFTLLELLLYISGSAIMLLAIVGLLFMMNQSRVKHETISVSDHEAVQAMQLITQSIRNASLINTPTAGATDTILSLQMASAGVNPTVFDISNGTLRITEGSGSPVALTSNKTTIASLSFQNLSRSSTAGTVKIQFTASRVNTSGRNEYDFSKTYYDSASIR